MLLNLDSKYLLKLTLSKFPWTFVYVPVLVGQLGPLPDLKLPPVILYVPVRPQENESKGKQSLYSYLTSWGCK